MLKTSRTGYTMIEVVLVMLVMGILAAAAAPRYSRMVSRFRVEAAARRIVADLGQVRARAMAIGAATGEEVSFYSATDRYQMHGDPDPNHPNQEYWVEFSKTAYPVDLVSATFTNIEGDTSSELMRYNMYGFPESGSSEAVPLASGEIVVALGGQLRTVVINSVTGKASVQ